MTRRAKNPNGNPVRIAGANKAIDMLGGSSQAAHLISEFCAQRDKTTGVQAVSRERVQAWKKYGIAPPWHPIIHTLTRIPLTELDPEIYPSHLFR